MAVISQWRGIWSVVYCNSDYVLNDISDFIYEFSITVIIIMLLLLDKTEMIQCKMNWKSVVLAMCIETIDVH